MLTYLFSDFFYIVVFAENVCGTEWLFVCHYAQNTLHTFLHNFPVDGNVANLVATSRCSGIWETARHNRYNGLLPVPTCYRLVTEKSPTCYGLAVGKLV